MARYSLDIDGVVADYREGLRRLTVQLEIAPLSQPVGLTPEALDAVMEERQEAVQQQLHAWIKDHLEEFWGGLNCMASAEDRRAIRQAAALGHELFWVSSRPSRGSIAGVVYDTTLRWLARHDLPVDGGHLFLHPEKSQILDAQRIACHLDDMVTHATAIALSSKTRPVLVKRPWNQHIMRFSSDAATEDTSISSAFDIPEVNSIAEYITLYVGAAQ